MTETTNTETTATTTEKDAIRVIATYDMMGDWEGVRWGNHVLGHAKRDGLVRDFKVLTSVPGVWGIEKIVFQVDLVIGEHGIPENLTGQSDRATGRYDYQDSCEDLLNRIVGDSDVQVIWGGHTSNFKLTDPEHDAGPEVPQPLTLSLAEVKNGTGFAPGTRFLPIPPA